MEARTLNIKGVFQNNTLMSIPFYQRRYVWDEKEHKNWSRFAEDMESTMTSSCNYFLGALILKELDLTDAEEEDGVSSKFQVVDGQQRLTTLSIYMKALSMLSGQSVDFDAYFRRTNQQKDPTIMHNCEDRPAFNKIMQLDTPQTDFAGINGNIIEAYLYFLDRLRKLEASGVKLASLRNKILSKVNFVVIQLKREDDEQQIFDTINSLGVDLATDELLKNYLYEEQDEAAYKTSWRKMFDEENSKKFWQTDATASRQSKKRGSAVIDRFLHAFVRIKMWDYPLNDVQKKEFVKTENIYATCKAFVETFGMSKQELAKEIISYAEIYREYLSDEVLDIRVPRHSGIKRISCFINATQTFVVLPYVLYILKNVSDKSEQNQIFDYLETYLIRRVLADANNKNYSDLFSENLIHNKTLTCQALKDYISQRDSSVSMPSNIDILTAMNKNKIKENTCRIVWYLYETKLESASNTSFTGGYNKYLAVQMMPAKCANWPELSPIEEEANRKLLICTLGNHFLLEEPNDRTMKRVSNDTYPAKKSAMSDFITNVRSSRQFLENKNTWDLSDIRDRNLKLGNLFTTKVWKI